MLGDRLPVIPEPGDDERLSHWLDRVATMNETRLSAICGRPVRADVIDRTANPQIVRNVSGLTGISQERVRQMTLCGRYPAAAAKNGRVLLNMDRPAHHVARCKHCGAQPGVSALLRFTVVCSRCDRLLSDDTYSESAVDRHLLAVQDRARESTHTTRGLAVLLRFTSELRRDVGERWAVAPKHEPAERLAHALDLLIGEDYSLAPAVMAVLLSRLYTPADCSVIFRIQKRRRIFDWTPEGDEYVSSPLADLSSERARLRSTIRASGLQVRQVPLGIDLGHEITPGSVVDVFPERLKWASTLRREVETVTGTPSNLPKRFTKRVAPWDLDDCWTTRLLTNTVIALAKRELIDTEEMVRVFGHKHVVLPDHLLRPLSSFPRWRYRANSKAIAAWLWMALSGTGTFYLERLGHRAMPIVFRQFDERFPAEDKIRLLEQARYELVDWPADVARLAGGRVTGPASGSSRAG